MGQSVKYFSHGYKKPQILVKTYAMLVFCVICWGSNFIFGTILVDVFDPMAIACLRLIFINIFLWGVGWKFVRRNQIPVRILFMLAGAGFIGVTVNQWTFYASLQHANPVTAAIILALSPMMTSLITFFYLKERRKIIFWIGVAVGFVGVSFVITSGNGLVVAVGKGELLITLTMLSFSIFLVIVQQLSKKLEPIIITLYTNIFGLLLFIPFIRVDMIEQSMHIDIKYWMLLIVTAILMHGICTMLWNASIQKVGAANASMLLNLEPFIVMVVGYIILQETVQSIQLMGALFIISGVIMGTYRSEVKDSSLKEGNCDGRKIVR
ncbi:DMT family transporter [Bacillus sp. B190/17]|uniref:DMT family transporter n=1 Tax=Bacillus lumedeiriae TaxID=3058829 RepID=A0ABW8IBC3_9BACI